MKTVASALTLAALVLAAPAFGVAQIESEQSRVSPVPSVSETGLDSFMAASDREEPSARSADLESAPARIRVQDTPLVEALRLLSSSSGVNVAYSPSLIPAQRPVSCDCVDSTVEEALEVILRGTGFESVVTAGQVVIRQKPNPSVPALALNVSSGWDAPEAEVDVRSAMTAPPREFQGTVTGRVVNAQSGEPITSAQVYIAGLDVGVLTQANGRYLLQNVATGTHTLTVERLGYTTQSREVTISEGETVVQNFELSQEALALDEIVVTGTAGAARQREVGNSITQLDVDQMVEAPSASIGEMLQGQVTGGNISVGAGTSGSAADIRLRGNVSMSMSNQPLIYIDGVRAKSEPYTAETGAADPMGPLKDLNPEDIERIEVVKGPAATTMYGTEAAAGVIQIFTKSGGGGEAVWNASVEQGLSYMRDGILGNEEAPNMYLDPVLRNGHRQRYGLSVRGGQSESVTYYVSGNYADNLGHVQTDSEERLSLRGNFGIQAADDLRIQFNNSLTQTDFRHPRYGNTISGIMMTAVRGQDSYMGSRSPEVLNTLLEEENITDVTRYVTGVTVSWTPGALTHRLTFGYDYSSFDVQRSEPYCWRCPMGFSGDRGEISRHTQKNTISSIDYTGTYDFQLTSDLGNTLSFGFQAVENQFETIEANGENFPGPGEWTVSTAEIRTGDQSKMRTITGGLFVQDRLAYLDRYFLTLGLRVDGNSAFGEDLGLEPYPKISGSYIISDESFWPEFFNQTKLRAAFGLAGRAPGAFDAVRTWEPVGYGASASAFEPANLGNPELGPEKTKEIEVGFDASFLGDRVTTNVTYYRQTTEEALMQVRRSSTLGGWNSQLENVGEILNQGWEIGIDADVLEYDSFRWNLGVGISTNESEVVSLGGQPPFGFGDEYGWVMEGQPAPVIRANKITNYWEQADPEVEVNGIYGPAYPTHIYNVTTSVTLPGGIRLAARGEYKGGYWMANYYEAGALSRDIENPKCYDAYRKVSSSWEPGPRGNNPKPSYEPVQSLYSWERAQCWGQDTYDLSTTDVDHFELRQITARLPLSDLAPSLTTWADRVDMTVGAQNVWFARNTDRVWLGHPEMNETDNAEGTHDLTKGIDESMPPTSYFTVSLRVGF